jgi:hypothetical protein
LLFDTLAHKVSDSVCLYLYASVEDGVNFVISHNCWLSWLPIWWFPIAAQDKMINEVDLWLMLWMKNRLGCVSYWCLAHYDLNLTHVNSLFFFFEQCEQPYKRTAPKRVKNSCENEFKWMKYVTVKNGWSTYFMNETYESSLGEIMYTVLASREKILCYTGIELIKEALGEL